MLSVFAVFDYRGQLDRIFTCDYDAEYYVRHDVHGHATVEEWQLEARNSFPEYIPPDRHDSPGNGCLDR